MNPQKTPLSFDEKSSIIKRHGIKNIKRVINPYMPTELINELDPTNTILIFAVSSKNVSNLKQFNKLTKYNGSSNLPIKDVQNPYVYYILTNEVKYDLPSFGRLNSENIFKALSDREAKLSELKSRFVSIFGWFEAELFNMIVKKFNTTRGELKDGKEELKPLQMVTRTFWNKVYESVINEVAMLPPIIMNKLEGIAKDSLYKLEDYIDDNITVESFEEIVESKISVLFKQMGNKSKKIVTVGIREEPYVKELKTSDLDAYGQIKLSEFNIEIRDKKTTIDYSYTKFKNLIDLALDDELPGTIADKLERAKKTEQWSKYELELKRLKNHNDFSMNNRALFDSDGSIYDNDYKSILTLNFDWFLLFLKLYLAKTGFIAVNTKKVIDDYIKTTYISLISHELIHFVQSIKQQIDSGERQYAKYEFNNPEKIGQEKFNKMYLSDKAEIGAHAYQFVTDLKKAYPNKSPDELLKMFQSGKLPKKKFSPMYNYIGYYMKLLNKGKQDETVKRFIKTVFLTLKKD